MNIRQLQAGDRVYVTINKVFSPVERRIGKQVIFETSRSWGSRPGKSFTQCKGSLLSHTTVNNEPALELQFISLIDPNNIGVARINYFSIMSLWLYEGETNIDTVVPHHISEQRNQFPYTAYQLPPVNIYRKRINLVW